MVSNLSNFNKTRVEDQFIWRLFASFLFSAHETMKSFSRFQCSENFLLFLENLFTGVGYLLSYAIFHLLSSDIQFAACEWYGNQHT